MGCSRAAFQDTSAGRHFPASSVSLRRHRSGDQVESTPQQRMPLRVWGLSNRTRVRSEGERLAQRHCDVTPAACFFRLYKRCDEAVCVSQGLRRGDCSGVRLRSASEVQFRCKFERLIRQRGNGFHIGFRRHAQRWLHAAERVRQA